MLYLVPTPIGNLSDFSPRALACLEEVDFIAAEDTRVTIKLLNHFQVKKPMLPYHRHNMETGGKAILERLLRGEKGALVSDAGTPAISDPGEELVGLCVEAGIPVCGVPGPCALTTALSISGLPTGRFTFEGFLAMNKKNRKKHLAELVQEERTMIFYEAPHKLTATLGDMAEVFGADRRVALCRELSKVHEEVLRFTLEEALAYYQDSAPRGEYVLVIAGCPPPPQEAPKLDEAVEQVLEAIEEGTSFRTAVEELAIQYQLSKNQLYKLAKAAVKERE